VRLGFGLPRSTRPGCASALEGRVKTGMDKGS